MSKRTKLKHTPVKPMRTFLVEVTATVIREYEVDAPGARDALLPMHQVISRPCVRTLKSERSITNIRPKP